MTAADEITYVPQPAIPGHLGTDAAHVHARQSDECLRAPEGVVCLSGAELRVEVEDLRYEAALRDNLVSAYEDRALSAEAERDALQQQVQVDRGAYLDLLRERDQERAKRRCLQQQVANVQALAAAWRARGEHDQQYATTLPDDMADALMESGADWIDMAGKVEHALAARRAAPTPEPTIAGYDGFGAPIMDHAEEPQPTDRAHRLCCEHCQPDSGEETEHGADTDAEAANQPQDGDDADPCDCGTCRATGRHHARQQDGGDRA